MSDQSLLEAFQRQCVTLLVAGESPYLALLVWQQQEGVDNDDLVDIAKSVAEHPEEFQCGERPSPAGPPVMNHVFLAGALRCVCRHRYSKRSGSTRVEAICGCTHHRSFHNGDGPCGAEYKTSDSKRGTYFRVCGCQGYVGPKTYSEVLNEEIES